MLLKGAQLEAIKRETANKLNNKFSPEEVQRIQNEMNEYITDYNENREQNYELEMKMLEKNDVSLMRESVKIVLENENAGKDVSSQIKEEPLTVKQDVPKF